MNTENANKYLDSLQISERSVYDRKDIEHPLDCLLEDYHQEQLKLLSISGFSRRLPLKDIEKKAKEWAKSRSNGDAEQDIECEYDYTMGMIKARNDLSGLNGC